MTTDDATPRGVRNNNPGNIRHGAPWVGLAPTQTDPAFCQFIDPQHGIRALCKVLLAYQQTHGLTTIRQMIDRWAPPADGNATAAYVQFVSGRCGVDPDAAFDVTAAGNLATMAAAIIAQECANYAYPASLVDAAVGMALG